MVPLRWLVAISLPDQQRIISAIQARAPQASCPFCHRGPFTLVDRYLSLSLSETAGAVVLGGSVLPIVSLVCSNCGHTQMFNLIVLGLADLAGQRADNG